MSFKSGFLQEASSRGFLFQCTDEVALDETLLSGTVGGYIGFDCTADSLHVGHMIQIMLLRLLRKYGHRPVVVIGGGTSRLGDPSFREEARQLLSETEIESNAIGICRNIESVLSFTNAKFEKALHDVVLVNNADWLGSLSYLDMLREVGRHFSISRMLSFDSVRSRLEREQGLTFLEFNYSILQSYDFLELYQRHGVTLQMGGSDQWGNIVSGVELIRRTKGKSVYGLTAPLISTASGAKMGKTSKGAVWLSRERLSAYDYWQFWRNTADADVGRFLRFFSELPLDEISRLEALGGSEINEAKKVLATEATALVHGEEAANQAAETAKVAFEEKVVAVTLPKHDVSISDLEKGVSIIRLLVESGLVTSNGEARRLIRDGGARINGLQAFEDTKLISLSDIKEGVIQISAGRKQHRLISII